MIAFEVVLLMGAYTLGAFNGKQAAFNKGAFNAGAFNRQGVLPVVPSNGLGVGP